MKFIILSLAVLGSCKAHAAGLSLVIILAAWGAIIAVLLDAVSRDKPQD